MTRTNRERITFCFLLAPTNRGLTNNVFLDKSSTMTHTQIETWRVGFEGFLSFLVFWRRSSATFDAEAGFTVQG